jgi:hypothetical protein
MKSSEKNPEIGLAIPRQGRKIGDGGLEEYRNVERSL